MAPPAKVDPAQPSGYGDAFADVYDQWYGGRSERDAAVSMLLDRAGDGPVLELGVGTGRLAVPLAEALAARGSPATVTGIDASGAMLARLKAKEGGHRVQVALSDMAALPFGGPSSHFSLVFAAWNTMFNLTAPGAQESCFAEVARVMAPDGRLLIDVYVPGTNGMLLSGIGISAATTTNRVLTVSRLDPTTRVVRGSHLELIDGGVRLRPWYLRPLPPDDLDELAAAAGLELRARWAGWSDVPFADRHAIHVSEYCHRAR